MENFHCKAILLLFYKMPHFPTLCDKNISKTDLPSAHWSDDSYELSWLGGQINVLNCELTVLFSCVVFLKNSFTYFNEKTTSTQHKSVTINQISILKKLCHNQGHDANKDFLNQVQYTFILAHFAE